MKFLTVLLLACTLAAVSAAERRVVCYFTAWTIYRPGNGRFDSPDVDTSLCTHINYGFVGLAETGELTVLDDWEATGLQGIEHLIQLKSQNPALKIFVSMGGWNEGSVKYSTVAASPALRSVMVQSSLAFIRKYGFDGLDLDWEYPCQRGGADIDKQNYVAWLTELRTALHAEGYQLSAAVGGAAFSIDQSYDVPAVSRLLDFLNVMVYDFHGAFDKYVGHVAPLYLSHLDTSERAKQLSVAKGIEHWIERGADPQKLNLGVVFYGRTFTLADPNNSSLYAPISAGGLAGPYSRQEGVLDYNEICELHSDMPDVWDDEQQVPHKLKGNQWYGYENQKSLELKVKFALSKNLGGIMVWSLDCDDFRGICGGGKYPLLKTVNRALGRQV